MDLKVPTIAERKAARRSQLTQPAPGAPDTASLQTSTPAAPTNTPAVGFTAPAPAEEAQPAAAAPAYAAPATAPATASGTKPRARALSSGGPAMDKDALLALARSMGLELAAAKKLWIKHSYSVTPESKEKFAHYCEVLGLKMQDGLEEALQDWFAKKASEYEAISHARNS